MNITAEQLTLMADGFGLLARGAKKIRGVLLLLAQNPTPGTAQGEPSLPSETPSEESVSDTESVDDDVILTEDFENSAKAYLFSKKMNWGKNFTKRYFTDMVRNRLRANNQKFVWVHTGGNLETRAHWKKISKRKAEDLYQKIRGGWEDILEFVTDHTSCPKGIRASKWERRKAITQSTMPQTLFEKNGFKYILVENHDDLPSLK